MTIFVIKYFFSYKKDQRGRCQSKTHPLLYLHLCDFFFYSNAIFFNVICLDGKSEKSIKGFFWKIKFLVCLIDCEMKNFWDYFLESFGMEISRIILQYFRSENYGLNLCLSQKIFWIQRIFLVKILVKFLNTKKSNFSIFFWIVSSVLKINFK